MKNIPINASLIRWLRNLRVSIGIIYFWFGLLKFFSGVSPAEELAEQTIHLLTFGLISPSLSLLLLALWETAVGLLLISGFGLKWVVRIVIVHMICTFAPLVLLPGLSFTSAPFSLTLVGQYIIKNIVVISALFAIDAATQPAKSAQTVIEEAADREPDPSALAAGPIEKVAG